MKLIRTFTVYKRSYKITRSISASKTNLSELLVEESSQILPGLLADFTIAELRTSCFAPQLFLALMLVHLHELAVMVMVTRIFSVHSTHLWSRLQIDTFSRLSELA